MYIEPLEYINSVDSLFSPRFEDNEESEQVCASGIITPNCTRFALNVKSIIVQYELNELLSEIQKLEKRKVKISGTVFNFDPRKNREKDLIDEVHVLKYYGPDFSSDIKDMIVFLSQNLVKEGYSLPECDVQSRKGGGR